MSLDAGARARCTRRRRAHRPRSASRTRHLLFEVPPGKSGCPFHNHHVEDELSSSSRRGTYRFGGATRSRRRCPGAPRRQETAHSIINTGTIRCAITHLDDGCDRGLRVSDSGKFWCSVDRPQRLRSRDARHLQYLDNSGVDYWDGDPAQKAETEVTTPMLEIRNLHARIEDREILKGVNLDRSGRAKCMP